MDLQELLRPPIDMRAIADFLDGLPQPTRISAIQRLTHDDQAALYDAARGITKITVDDIVPAGLAPLAEVIHWGRNSLAAFRLFQKRFCRPDDAAAVTAGEVWGYNHQTYATFTGPGYFVAYNLPDGEVLIDYTRLPPYGAPAWPKVIPNTARLSRYIYNGTQDTLRGVSRHVTIGRAARRGDPLPNWFVLCREDPDDYAPGESLPPPAP